MNVNLKMARWILESQLNDAASGRKISDSIRIQQLADPIDMTQEAGERDLAVQIIDRESILVRRLRSAIKRIDAGSYGVCLQCEEEIAQKRLKALPWAELCIRCQERADDLQNQGKPLQASEDRTETA